MSRVKWILKVWFMVIVLVTLGACSSGGGSGSTGPVKVELSALGVSQVVLDGEGAVVPGVEQSLLVRMLSSADGSPVTTTVLELNGAASGVALGKSNAQYLLTITTTSAQQGQAITVPLKVFSSDRKRYAEVNLTVTVASIVDAAQAVLSTGTVDMGKLPETTVKVSAANLTAPVEVSTVVTEKPNGEKVFQVKFSRNVAGEGVRISLPKAVTYDPQGILLANDAENIQRARPAAPLSAGTLGEISRAVRSAANSVRYGIAAALGDGLIVNSRMYESGDDIADDHEKKGLGKMLVRKVDCFLRLASAGGFSSVRLWPGGDGSQSCDVFVDSKPWYKKDYYELMVSSRPAIELHSSVMNNNIQSVDWNGFVPVVYIHGFDAFDLGGGQGTWDKFPKLAAATSLPGGDRMVPFEFHWDTNANIYQAAGDLASAIGAIQRMSGKKVHVVAHSFGGVLTRVLLQGLASDPNGAAAKVASLTTLGTPHSGIFGDGDRWANGRDSLTFPLCMQLSCWQMGLRNVLVDGTFSEWKENNDFNVNGEMAGYVVDELEKTRGRLPELPIHVGIGLIRNAVGDRIGNGDYLISFAGQRFVPFKSWNEAVSGALLNAEKIGQATVTEEILGWESTVRPGSVVSDAQAGVLPTLRQNGYLHTSGTGFGNIFSADGGGMVGRGLMAAPSKDCDVPLTCTHAGYILFSQVVGNVVASDLQAAIELNKFTPMKLVPNPEAQMTSAQAAYVQDMLNQLSAKGAVAGGRVFWDWLSDADAIAFNQGLAARFADTTRVVQAQQDYLKNMEDFSSFRLKYMQNANHWMVVDKDNAVRFLQIGANMYKAGVGMTQAIYPELGLLDNPVMAEGRDYVEWVNHLHPYAAAFRQYQPLVDFMAACLPMAISDWKKATDNVLAGNPSANDVLTFLKEPIGCIASGLNFADRDALRATAVLLKADLDMLGADGKKLNIASAMLSSASLGLEFLPPSIQVSRLKGMVDLLNAYVDAIIIGQEMADHTSAVVSVEQDKLLAVLDKMDAQLLRQRVLRVLAARADGLYIAQPVADVVISQVACVNTHVGAQMTCTATGKNLPDGLAFSANGCTGVQELAGGTATQRVFVCTPSTVGALAVTISGASGGDRYFTQSLAVTAAPVSLFMDEFDGSSLKTASWNLMEGSGGWSLAGGKLTLGAGSEVSTLGKVVFYNGTLVVEVLLAGTGTERDSHFELVEEISGDRIRVGDTSSQNMGVYVMGTGQFLLDQTSTGWPTTTAFKAYRMTLKANILKVERGDSLDQLTEKSSYTLPSSVVGKVFAVQLGAGASGEAYAPAVFESVRVAHEPTLPVSTGKLPDTGITAAQCYAAGSNALVSCTSAAAVALNSSQDGMVGRDVSTPSATDGKLGFSYTKIAADGSTLPANATTWACVKDNLTGLMWEVKTADGGLRHYANTYTHYGNGSSGDASAFVVAVNAAGLCGKTDWRLPTADELQGLVDYGVDYRSGQPLIDINFFPNTVASLYWTSSPLVGDFDYAWRVSFHVGDVGNSRAYGYHVRLVR